MEEIIGIILNNWTGLKMCIEHGMGGSSNLVAEKVSCMIKIIIEKLNCAKVSWENISDLLEEFMDVEFNTILEDGSPDEVAQIVCELFYLWKEGNQDELNAKINIMTVKTPLQQEYRVLPTPQNVNVSVLRVTDTAGNSYTVENTSDDGWTEVKHRR
uniref:Pre-rRNA-processing protein TSR2 homolog n=1 Tax=Panstrongylus megistus TaxID=65343 RepID=A0A069DW79_9HEMI